LEEPRSLLRRLALLAPHDMDAEAHSGPWGARDLFRPPFRRELCRKCRELAAQVIEAAVRDDALAPSVELQLLLRQVPAGDEEVDADPLDLSRPPDLPLISLRSLEDIDRVLLRRIRRLEDHASHQVLVIRARDHFQPRPDQQRVSRRPLLLALGVRDALARVV